MATVRACSFNVRYDTPKDEYGWDTRRESVLETLQEIEADLLGIQEALPHQYEELRGGLEGYDWYGVGRRDGAIEGEFVPVAWRADRFEALETGAFWLSETSEQPSIGWNATLPRVTTWASLRDRETDTRLWVLSTHFSHQGDNAQLESARLLRRRIEDRLSSGDSDAVVVLGDFNCTPNSSPYRVLTEGPLEDARSAAETVTGPAGTFHGFSGEPSDRIDYVFVAGLSVQQYRTVDSSDAVPRSDHLPVFADLEVCCDAETSGK